MENDPFRFVTSADSGTDRFYKNLLRTCVAVVRREVGDEAFVSLVLGGSLAAGEGSAHARPGGGKEPGSDIDLYLVAKEGSTGELGARMPRVRERLLSALGVPGLVVDLGVTTPARLASAAPTIAGCLLARFGKCLAGDPAPLRRASGPRPEEIPPREGFLLLQNRIVEELIEFTPGGAEARAWAFWFRFGKTVRDLGTSALVTAGAFVPSLAGQREALPVLAAREGLAATVPGFTADHRFWCDQKVRPEIEQARERYGGGRAGIEEAQRRKREYVRAVWEWEADRLFGRAGRGGVLASLRRADRLRRRVRRWALHVRREGATGVPATLRHLALGLPVTPLVADYAAAYLLLLSSGPLTGGAVTDEDRRWLEEARRALPDRAGPAGPFADRWLDLRQRVCQFWNREVMGSTRPPAPVRLP